MIDVTVPILHPTATSETEILASMVDAGIPPHLQQGLCAYLLHGRRPGHFLQALLKNDLTEAITRYAGDLNDLHTILIWLLNAVPRPALGSPQDVERWITKKSLEQWAATCPPEAIE